MWGFGMRALASQELRDPIKRDIEVFWGIGIYRAADLQQLGMVP